MNNKKKILFVLPFLPYPLVSGGHQALFNGVLAVKDDYDVSIAYPSIKKGAYIEDKEGFVNRIPNVSLHPFCDINSEFSIIGTIKEVCRKLFGLFRSKKNCTQLITKTWQETYLPPQNTNWICFINNICKKESFDIIQVEMPWMISQIFCLPDDCLKIYVHHELGFVMRQLQLDSLKNTGVLDGLVLPSKKFSDLNEISQLNLYDMVVTLSSVDANKLIKMGVSKPVRASFAVVNASMECENLFSAGKDLSFVGSDTHLPNYRGIVWFLENCWNKIKSQDKNIKLRIIGKWNEDNVEQLKSTYKDVEFLGFVDNLQSALSGTIMIVPILEGSGIRMKILEACSLGIPFVSTSIGAEGIPVINDEHCYLADTASDFVNAILMLQNVEIQQRFSINSSSMIKKSYSLEALRINRHEIYEELLNNRCKVL